MVQPICCFALCILMSTSVLAQKGTVPFQEDFPPEEFSQRRDKVYDAIGEQGIALLQGAANPPGYITFRQDNNFYYLSGVETPHAYLLLDGANREAILFLQHSNEAREAFEGLQFSVENADLVTRETGIDNVLGSEGLGEALADYLHDPGNVPALYLQFSPAENRAASRDMGLRTMGDIANDPWDGRPSRQSHFVNLVKTRFPGFEVKDLTPILDNLRLIKSPLEIEMIRRASRASGLGLMEAMRSTKPGRFEYELDAVCKLIFYRLGAQSDAYYSLVATGKNAWINHYNTKKSVMEDGELVLMDYAPDIGYYVSDITRMWPVNGKFSPSQREIYQFYLDFHSAILDCIKPGLTPKTIMLNAVKKMEKLLANRKFSKSYYANAARKWVDDYRRNAERRNPDLGHWVGMAVHDVGFDVGPLRPGMVFTVEPDVRVPEEKLFISVEEIIVITEEGYESLSAFVPKEVDEIEALMQEDGILDWLETESVSRK